MLMRKIFFMYFIVLVCIGLILPRTAFAQLTVSDSSYQWVQSSARINYYFNISEIRFFVDDTGRVDRNILLVKTVKSFDWLQIQDVVEKRKWKGLDSAGYENLAGAVEDLIIDVQHQTVFVKTYTELDTDWNTLESSNPNRLCDLAKLSTKSFDHIFYGEIIKYAALHQAELQDRSIAYAAQLYTK